MKEKIFSLADFQFDGQITETEFNGIYVCYDGKDAKIGFRTKAQRARAYLMLSMKAPQGPFELRETPRFDTIGPMLDMSRGRVMTVDGIRRYIDYIAALGMNMLMLYTEDLFELEGYPQFGYLRGKYTIQELQEVDAYGKEMGVELIPCIQTFGHLGQYFKNPEAASLRDTKSVLLAGSEETYAFIEAELKAMRKAFSTDRIHLGMDETFGLGTGQYLKKNGYRDPAEIYRDHLARVLKICEKYFDRPMIWSDMIFDSPDGKVYSENYVPPQSVVDATPKGVDLVFWDYYHDRYEWYKHNVDQHARFPEKTLFGGAVWTWSGLAPNLSCTLRNTKPALEACLDGGVREVIITMWNDSNGADYMQALPGLCIFSEYCYRGKECTDEDIFAVSAFLTGVNRELFHATSDIYLGAQSTSSAIHSLLYGDSLLNLTHRDIDFEEAIKVFQKAKAVLSAYPQYRYLEFYETLYDLAIDKAEILSNLKTRYRNGDRAYLKETKDAILPRILENTQKFYRIHKALWYANYKGFGLEMFTHDFGGAILRLQDSIELIEDYLSGRIDRIDALEEEPIKGLKISYRGPTSYLAVYR